jgi:RNA polymerase sigma-70 factor (ECF subfamily)
MSEPNTHKPPPAAAPEPADEELIRRCLEGQPEAYRLLVERYWSVAYSLARRIMDGHDEAVDVAQEAFVRAYQHLKEFTRESRFPTWLLRVTSNYALDLKRRKRARERLRVHVPVYSYTPAPDSEAIAHEEESRLSEILRDLSHHQRLAIVLKVVHGLDTPEVARILGCSEGTVRVHLHQARKALRDRWSGWRR